MRLMEFKLIGTDNTILINCNSIVTIVYSGKDRTELRLINGGVHMIDGSFTDTKKRLKHSIVPNPNGDD